MLDKYYVDLVRCMLAKAESDLLNAQNYAEKANSEISFRNIQKIINMTRRETDRIMTEAMLPDLDE